MKTRLSAFLLTQLLVLIVGQRTLSVDNAVSCWHQFQFCRFIDVLQNLSQGGPANVWNWLWEQHIRDGWEALPIHRRIVSLLPSPSGNLAEKASNDASRGPHSGHYLHRMVVAQSEGWHLWLHGHRWSRAFHRACSTRRPLCDFPTRPLHLCRKRHGRVSLLAANQISWHSTQNVRYKWVVIWNIIMVWGWCQMREFAWIYDVQQPSVTSFTYNPMKF